MASPSLLANIPGQVISRNSNLLTALWSSRNLLHTQWARHHTAPTSQRSSSCRERGCSRCSLRASLVAEHRLEPAGASAAPAPGLRSLGSWPLELRLGSRGTRQGMWDLLGSGGGFLTAEPPGKPYPCFYSFRCSSFLPDTQRFLLLSCSFLFRELPLTILSG